MTFVLDHPRAILFVLLFALGVVLTAALIRDYLNAGPACVQCGCTERRASRADAPLCSNCWWAGVGS